MITYKLHSLPDYPDSILRFGTTDSTSTQNGELAHRLVKLLYRRTNKRDHVRQIAKHEHRRRLIPQRKEQSTPTKALPTPINKLVAGGNYSPACARNPILPMAPTCHQNNTIIYRILEDPSGVFPISSSIQTLILVVTGLLLARMEIDKQDDPALKNFVLNLKAHLRCRLLDLEESDDMPFSQDDLIKVVIEKELLYTHATMRVNYTTYDVRRDQDMLNPRTRKFFMVHAQDSVDPHRF
ncbi:hypothetical protein MIND_01147300 [Mycena indigotica]|uniref:Uncharacterized protein n=1 Tax=Mycena indigotica TaxID=2126181 RepID=A0A8H6VXD9_9AGAR|nr:uncharacterized protein MIND_01147300 [Mycena indigotica]KAF7293673.1 hypothetical protein MIND_01147300 [Mycena indigotica]